MARMDSYPENHVHHIGLWLPNLHKKKSSLKNEDCGKNGTYTGHLQAKQ
jgi:hypothetical protein